MVAKISVGSSLYGAIAYNGEKINEAQGRLLTTNRIYNDGSGTVDIGKASIWKNSVSETSLILYSSMRTSTATTCTS